MRKKKEKGVGDDWAENCWTWPCSFCAGPVALTDEKAVLIQRYLEAGGVIAGVMVACMECSYKHHPPTKEEGVQRS